MAQRKLHCRCLRSKLRLMKSASLVKREDRRETERTNLERDCIEREDKREKSRDRKDNQGHADQLEWERKKFNREEKLVTD
ncbi:hypothetical protein PtA15_4A490 [Puccinia triticina]|nr:uncharacterized protein PtA15_4A490 [Puccinia triticina]WAQ84039.1 hypothetical protein PtA15_4A490 [Puccinia triticina]